MSAIEKDKHLHIYQRSVDNKEVYRCIHPDCPHYQRRAYLVGKRAECPKCHQPFIIQQVDVKAGQVKPGKKNLVCFNCSKSPKAAVQNQIISKLDEVFKEMEKDTDNSFTFGDNTFEIQDTSKST